MATFPVFDVMALHCRAARDASSCAKWLLRDETGMTKISKHGLLDHVGLLELTKQLSMVGSIIYRAGVVRTSSLSRIDQISWLV